MRVNSVTKTDEGTFSFDGEITQQEHDIVVTMGLNFLLAQGLLETLVPNVEVTEVNETTIQQ